MILIVGLGNPGLKYRFTRHNVGFMVIDELLSCFEATQLSKASFKGELFRFRDILLLKPTTFMNLSGISVSAVANFYKVSRIIVIHDDLDLPFSSLRFKYSGSSGGHNGIKSIDSHIGSQYERIRIGIGKPEQKEQVIDFVLQDFSSSEQAKIDKLAKYIADFLSKNPLEDLETMRNKYSLKDGIC